MRRVGGPGTAGRAITGTLGLDDSLLFAIQTLGISTNSPTLQDLSHIISKARRRGGPRVWRTRVQGDTTMTILPPADLGVGRTILLCRMRTCASRRGIRSTTAISESAVLLPNQRVSTIDNINMARSSGDDAASLRVDNSPRQNQ